MIVQEIPSDEKEVVEKPLSESWKTQCLSPVEEYRMDESCPGSRAYSESQTIICVATYNSLNREYELV